MSQIIQAHNNLAEEGLAANNTFVPENYNEELSKTVNDIYYRTYLRGIDALSTEDIKKLKAIT